MRENLSAVGQRLKQIRMNYFGKRWKWRVRSATQKDLFQGLVDGHQRSIGQMRFEEIACVRSAGLPAEVCGAQWSTAKGCWPRCQDSKCCPLQSARPHRSGGGCLSRDSPGSLGLAISVGPAQLSCGCSFAEGAQSPLA